MEIKRKPILLPFDACLPVGKGEGWGEGGKEGSSPHLPLPPQRGRKI